MSERAMVVLPEPDSPMRATTSPGAMEKLTSLTMRTSSPRSLRAVTRNPSTSTSGGMSAVLRRESTARHVVDQEVDADRQRGDRRGRHHHGRRAFAQAGYILAHQGAPIGEGRLNAEPEKAEAAEQQHSENEAQPKIGQDRTDDIRQNLLAYKIGAALAARTRHGDIVHRIDVDRERPPDTECARRVDHRGRSDQHGDRRA